MLRIRWDNYQVKAEGLRAGKGWRGLVIAGWLASGERLGGDEGELFKLGRAEGVAFPRLFTNPPIG